MNLPLDLKSYQAPDAFQLITPEEAIMAFITLVCVAAILEPVLR